MMFASAARRLLELVPAGTIVPIVSGPLRGMRWTMHSAPHGCWAGIYERVTQRLFAAHVATNDVVYDVGANVGFFTLLASRLAPRGRVFAFEPFPRNVAILTRHIELNRLANVEIMPIALAARSGLARFEPGGSTSQGRLSSDGALTVSSASIDELVREGQAAPPDVMKIDVEGAESEVLDGARATILSRHPTIILSTHGYVQQDLCWEFLSRSGYRPQLIKDGTADGDYLVLAPRPTSS